MRMTCNMTGARRGVAALAFALTAAAASAQDKTFDFADEDREMNAAMAAAKASLPLFFEAIQRPGARQPMVKVAVDASDVGNSLEHIWTGNCDASPSHDLACVVMNEPHTSNVRMGEPHHFNFGDISDWAYFDAEGRMHGAFTIRVILPQLPEDQAAQYRAMLAPLPE